MQCETCSNYASYAHISGKWPTERVEFYCGRHIGEFAKWQLHTLSVFGTRADKAHCTHCLAHVSIHRDFYYCEDIKRAWCGDCRKEVDWRRIEPGIRRRTERSEAIKRGKAKSAENKSMADKAQEKLF